jgi:cytochrome c oxidase subunit 2
MISFLTYIAIILGVIAIARLVKVYELSSSLKGTDHEESVTEADSRFNGRLMMPFLLAFFAFCIYLTYSYKDNLLPESASAHGVEIDTLFNFNLIIITIVFVAVNVLLFYFAYKYYSKKDLKATYFAHSTKLELIWTIVPAVFLAVIIIYGLAVWNKITSPADPNKAVVMELFAEQFKWTARYGGSDNTLGESNYKLTADMNPLAIDSTDKHAWDDKIVSGEFHIPVNKTVLMYFRSKDVIHSAYMPHFRAQMNCVPGMRTEFHFTPTITTAQMKEKTNNPDFDYVLLCNKICGATHWNMQMKIVVDSEADYQKWLAEQKTFKEKNMAQPAASEKIASN